MEEKVMSKREKNKEAKRNKMIEVSMKEFAKKAYSDVSTDVIVAKCGISKGLLFHYFTSKKNLYLVCLETALKQTTYAPVKEISIMPESNREAFYELLWAQFEARMEVEENYPLEKNMIEMASREEAEEVRKEKKELMDKFLHLKGILTAKGVSEALEFLTIKTGENPIIIRQGMSLYIDSVREQLLKKREIFTEEELKQEFIALIDVLLDGVCV